MWNVPKKENAATKDRASRNKGSIIGLLAAMLMSLTLILVGCSSGGADKTPADAPDDEQLASGITVKVTVECHDAIAVGIEEAGAIAPTGVLFEGDIVISEGATALEVLKATGLDVSMAPGDFTYVNGINGLSEQVSEEFPMSGWMFYVNGEMAMEGCDTFVMNDGDTLLWKYSLTFD